MAGEVEEFVAGGDGVVEAAEHGRGDHAGVLLFDAAHHHAQVLGFDDDADALGLEGVHEGAGDLVGETLLHLEAAGEEVGEAGELADANDLAAGDVADVADAEEGQEVVLAQRIDFDVADDDHVVGFDLEHGGIEEGGGILFVAADEVGPGLGGPLGRPAKAFAFGILAEGDDPVFDDVVHGAGFSHKPGGTAIKEQAGRAGAGTEEANGTTANGRE